MIQKFYCLILCRSCAALSVALLLGMAGCNRGAYDLVQLSGTVTFDGGECPAPGSVTLQPLEVSGELPNRPATGQFGKDGRYTINAFSSSKGVLPGRYLVEVTCFAGVPNPSKPDPWADVNYIAEEYEPEELTIEANSPKMTFDIDVPQRNRSGG